MSHAKRIAMRVLRLALLGLAVIFGWFGSGTTVVLAESSHARTFTESVPSVTVPAQEGVHAEYRMIERNDGTVLVTVYLDRVPEGYSVKHYWQDNYRAIARHLTPHQYGEDLENPREVFWDATSRLETMREAYTGRGAFFSNLRADRPWELAVGIFTPTAIAPVAEEPVSDAIATLAEPIPEVVIHEFTGAQSVEQRIVDVGNGYHLATVSMVVDTGYTMSHFWELNKGRIAAYFTAERSGMAGVEGGRNVFLETASRLAVNRAASSDHERFFRTMQADVMWEFPIAYLRTRPTSPIQAVPIGTVGQDTGGAVASGETAQSTPVNGDGVAVDTATGLAQAQGSEVTMRPHDGILGVPFEPRVEQDSGAPREEGEVLGTLPARSPVPMVAAGDWLPLSFALLALGVMLLIVSMYLRPEWWTRRIGRSTTPQETKRGGHTHPSAFHDRNHPVLRTVRASA